MEDPGPRLQGLTPEALRALVPVLDPREARALVSAFHRRAPFDGARVRRVKIAAMLRAAPPGVLAVREERKSALDPFVKLVLATEDGRLVETVRIPLEVAGRYSVCVSSQVGCALACAFCATGQLGLGRNLAAWEIVEQVRLVRFGLDAGRVHGVVFQGMGEPLANADAVLQAIRVLTDSNALAVDAKAVTVCTAGIPRGIRRLAAEAPKVRLAVSLGSAQPEVRRRLMPVSAVHPLAEVLEAAAEHAKEVRRAPLLALTLLRGVNDGEEEAEALARLVHDFAAATGIRPRLSIIPFNAVEGAGFERTPPEVEDGFRDALRARGVFSHKRYSGGADVAAACGQLAAADQSHVLRAPTA